MYIQKMFTKKIGIPLIVIAIALIITSTHSDAVSELTVEERMEIRFPDLDEAPWAEPEIRQLTLRGVLGGFPDGTFRPNAPIKKIEAIVMAVRSLGLEPEAKELEKSNDPYMYLIEGQGLEWAEGYLSAAYRNGLISGYTQELNWYELADRTWMAQLMVRMIRKEEEAKEVQYPLYFNDRQDILPNQRGYVQVVQQEGLMTGYPDNTFRPKASMTRAELSVLFMNYFDTYMSDYTLYKSTYGFVEDYDASTGVMMVRDRYKGMMRYQVHPLADVFYQPAQWGNDRVVERRSIQQIRKGQQIDYILRGESIVYVSVTSEGYEQDATYDPDYTNVYDDYETKYNVGFIKSLDRTRQRLIWEDLNGEEQQYSISPNIKITDLHGATGDVQIGALYRAIMADTGRAGKQVVELERQDERMMSYTGDLVSYNTYNSELTIRHSQSQSDIFFVPEGISVATQYGEYVRIFAYGRYIYDIEVLRPMMEQGYFVKYDQGRKQIYMSTAENKEKIYNVVDTPRVRFGMNSQSELSNLQKGSYLRVTFDRYDQNGNGIYDEVIEIELVDQIVGSFVRVLSKNIVFLDEHGIERRLDIADDVHVLISNHSQATVSDLRKNDQMNIRLVDGKVQRIDVYQRNMEEGVIYEIRAISDGNKQIVLGESAYYQRSYQINSKTDVMWSGYQNISQSNLYTGQTVRVWYEGEIATTIEIIDVEAIRGQVIDYNDRYIWLQGADNDRARFSLSDRVQNVKAFLNKVVELQFDQGVVTRIQIVEETEHTYVIVQVNIEQKTIWVRNDQGKHFIYWLPDDTILFQREWKYLDEIKDSLRVKRRYTMEIVNETVVSIDNG